MKTLTVILLFVAVCSCKKGTHETMTVIKGCEGAYLRFNNVDYTICNEESLQHFENGRVVTAEIVKRNECFCYNSKSHCVLVHNHATAEGLYKVIKISAPKNP